MKEMLQLVSGIISTMAAAPIMLYIAFYKNDSFWLLIAGFTVIPASIIGIIAFIFQTLFHIY